MSDADDGRRIPGALFSMDASDNAEVVPPDAPRGPDSLWSTEAADPDPDGPAPGQPWAEPAAEPVDPWQHFAPGETFVPPANHGVFSAEPVGEDEFVDVVDEVQDGRWEPVAEPHVDGPFGAPQGPPVFSSGTASDATRRRDRPPRPPTSPPWQEPASDRGQGAEPWADVPPAGADPFASGPGATATSRPHETAAAAHDPHGLDAAIARLSPDDQERARVPLAVCGALLAPGEQVLGAVTGRMLGRPAAVVVTRARVLVVNDRRWQPIVDIYPIDGSLVVRGRHDRQVAALSFADDERLSMVDGIAEVEIAIDLAEAIRDPAAVDRAAGTEF